MKPQFLSIPTPCSENWNEMSATEQGAFCAKCTKEVLDCSDLKASEIKARVGKAANPCIRIRQPQIDEVNFLEWFEHLSLRKQLKYAFLFAFLLIFSQSNVVYAQNDTLIQPQFVEIDSADYISQEALEGSYEMVEEKQVLKLEYDPMKAIIWEPAPGLYYPEIISTMGMIVTGNFTETPDAIKSPYFFPDKYTVEEETIPKTPYLQFRGNNFTFSVLNDLLVFHANGRQKTVIHLIIRKKDSEKIVYTDPIQIKPGQQTLEFPLQEFDPGLYIVTVQHGDEEKSIQIPIW